MRTLPPDLNAHNEPRRKIAWAQTMHILVHPEDAGTRGESLATMASEALGRYDADPESLVARADPRLLDASKGVSDEATARASIDDIARQSLSIVARELFRPAGGFASVARAKGVARVADDAGKNLLAAAFAGFGLCTLYQIAHHTAPAIRGGASMNKVWWLLERDRDRLIVGPSDQRRMKELWAKFKNVSHLGAAAYLLWEKRGSDATDVEVLAKEIPTFLRIAKRFEDFGTSFRPGSASTAVPVLDPDQIWRVPVNASAEDEFMPSGLSVRTQLLLHEYRAAAQLP